VVAANTTVGVVQEIKAGQAIAAYLLPGAVLVHDSKHRWRIFPDHVAALGGTSADTAGPVSRQ